jgi:hypothetical protein
VHISSGSSVVFFRIGNELLVSYKKSEDAIPWTRPLYLFVDKFEEVDSNVPT